MSAIGDITNLLEKIPLWKRLGALPEQVAALQARVSALEVDLQKRPSLERCPICSAGDLKVTGVNPHPSLGAVGIQERTMRCDNAACGHTEKRIHDPAGRMGKSTG
jgi:hypothetical protein